jgi:hypothetical protein
MYPVFRKIKTTIGLILSFSSVFPTARQKWNNNIIVNEEWRERDLGVVNETVAGPRIGRQLPGARKLQALYDGLQNQIQKTLKTHQNDDKYYQIYMKPEGV